MKNIILILIGILFLSSCGNRFEAEKIQLSNHRDSISYIIGYDYGEGIAIKNLHVSKEALIKGLLEGMTGQSSLPDTVITQLVLGFQQEIDAREDSIMQETIKKTIAFGAEYLAKNIKQQDIVELDNGLQYKRIKNGEGIKPLAKDSVAIHFRAMFLDGTTFDMSYDQGPATVQLNKMIKGLSQGIQLMQTGAIYEFYIPYYLAYGEKDFANIIPGGSTLHYHVELIKVYQ